jgi:FkbM family methyltransferase
MPRDMAIIKDYRLLPHLCERQSLESVSRANAKAFYVGNNSLMCRVLGRYKMYVEASDQGITPHLAMDGFWEPWVTVCVARNVKDGWSCINVGANVGYYTLLLAELVGSKGHVSAFEPNPALFGFLKANIDINGFDKTCGIFETAASDCLGTAWLSVPSTQNRNGHVIDIGAEHGSAKASHPISLTPIDSSIFGTRDFLMCDSEGHEPQVLRGAEKLIDRSPQLQMLLEWGPERYQFPKETAGWILDREFKPSLVVEDGSLKPMSADEFLALDHEEMLWFSR